MTKARTPARTSGADNHELPTQGGSYIRQGDGSLLRMEGPDAEAPAAPDEAAPATPADDSQEG